MTKKGRGLEAPALRLPGGPAAAVPAEVIDGEAVEHVEEELVGASLIGQV